MFPANSIALVMGQVSQATNHWGQPDPESGCGGPEMTGRRSWRPHLESEAPGALPCFPTRVPLNPSPKGIGRPNPPSL